MRGWVYIISNKSMPGLLKVGFTTKDPESRATELNSTGAPHPYKVEYDALVYDPYKIEQAVQKKLKCKLEGKEWFRCDVFEAIKVIRDIAGEQILVEDCELDIEWEEYQAFLAKNAADREEGKKKLQARAAAAAREKKNKT